MAQVIALCGFMGSGKTTVGRRVAAMLSRPFLDLDEEIERRTGRTIPSIFAEDGEQGFRQAEFDALAAVLDAAQTGESVVLALGGGTLTWPRAMESLRRRALVFYLEVSADTAWRRAKGTTRPLASDPQAFGRLLASRTSTYHQAAHHVIRVDDMTVDEIASQVAVLAQPRLAAGAPFEPDLPGRPQPPR